MAKKWCANFDVEGVLKHGLANDMWLMQYQYSHGGYDFQGHSTQIAMTTANWKSLRRVEVGDWFAAYLSGRASGQPNSMFYAIGEVTAPRPLPRHSAAAHRSDTVERTVRDHSHLFLDGVVRYSDAAALYDDFTDSWTWLALQNTDTQPERWQYPERIDVREWEHIVPDGVQVDGLSEAAPFMRNAVFEITESFFDKILAGLRNA